MVFLKLIFRKTPVVLLFCFKGTRSKNGAREVRQKASAQVIMIIVILIIRKQVIIIIIIVIMIIVIIIIMIITRMITIVH